MKTADVFVFTGGLDDAAAVLSVHASNGTPLFADGPSTETKEHLGGFAVVDVADEEAAQLWAGRIAAACGWPQRCDVSGLPGPITRRRRIAASRHYGPRSRCPAAHSRRPTAHAVARCDTLRYTRSIADHYTLRLAPGIRQRLTDWARRSGMPERSLAQRYVDEGLRHDAHPLIQFLDGPSGRRAGLAGRSLDVWEVIATIRDNNGSIAQASDYLQVPAGLIEAAVAYYGEYTDEIDAEIDFNQAEYERGIAAAAAGEQALRR